MHRTLVQYVGSGWRRAGLLLANFFPFGLSLVSVPEVFARVNSTQFPWRINLGYLPLHGKTGIPGGKIKWFALFCSGSFGKYGL